MSTKVFIDGEVGTTGLQIRAYLEPRADIELLRLEEKDRKNLVARAEALNAADIAILCLPDAAAIESVSLIKNDHTRVIDASTAHRTNENWAYGFPEMTPDQRGIIAGAKRLANPGCYPQGYIALVRPLVENGILPPLFPATYNAISGYSGGGKKLIAEYETAENPVTHPYWPYGFEFRHKHMPEMALYAGLEHAPVFQPAVGKYKQGMIGAVPLNLWALNKQPTLSDIHACLSHWYEGQTFVKVVPLEKANRLESISPERLNGTNSIHIHVHGDDETGQAVILAVYDNLGKGASGAAVQGMNIMMGIDETTGLVKAPL